MIDFDNTEKFEKRVSTWSREVYVTPDFDKFHGELSFLIEETGLKDIYTTKRAAAYVNGKYITFDSIFQYQMASPVKPKNEESLKEMVFDAVKENVKNVILKEEKNPKHYIMVIKFIDVGTDEDESVRDISIRSAFYNFAEDEQA